jgi:hypothetical protein
MIREDICINSANIVPFLMSHTDVSSKSVGILNLECVVRPFGKSKDAIPDEATEASGQTATLGGPTASRSHVVARPCAPPAAVVVEAIVVIPSPMRANLYALLQCGEDSEYVHKTYGGYIEVFRTLVVEDGESSPPASGNFQSTCT